MIERDNLLFDDILEPMKGEVLENCQLCFSVLRIVKNRSFPYLRNELLKNGLD